MGRGSVDFDACDIQITMPRSLDEAAVASLRSAFGRNRAIRARRIIRPDDHLAAIALQRGIGFDRGLRAEERDVRVLHLGVIALVVTADEYLPTAFGARGIELRLIHYRYARAQHFHAAALGARGNNAPRTVDIGIPARLEEYPPSLLHHAARVELAAVLHQHACHPDAARFGHDLAEVGCTAFVAGDLHLHTGRAGVDQLHRLARREQHFAAG